MTVMTTTTTTTPPTIVFVCISNPRSKISQKKCKPHIPRIPDSPKFAASRDEWAIAETQPHVRIARRFERTGSVRRK
jgi:hypothetical protein